MTPETLIRDGARALGQTLEPARLHLLARYCELVIKWNRVANLTGARRATDFARKFVVDALAVRPHVEGAQVVDLGSGAGLPGMVLAIVMPDTHFHLVEPRARRARFLEQARIELGLSNVAVHCVRIEDWQPAVPIDAIICQAVGSLAFMLEATAHLHGRRARILALKGLAPDAELAELGPAAEACGTIRLEVPGWAARHLVCIDCARLPAPA
jgi:16S rRNA (guanine527-N7)-methyltransferase